MSAPHHGLHREALNAGLGVLALHALQHGLRGSHHRQLILQIERYAADIRFV